MSREHGPNSGAPWEKSQGYLAHKKQPPSLGPPQGPKHSPTAGSQGKAVSYERGTPLELGIGRDLGAWCGSASPDIERLECTYGA